MKTKRVYSCVVCVFLLACVTLAGDKVNLSGTWVLDKDKSFSNGPGFEQTMKLTHTGDNVKLEAKQKTPRGETNINEDYALDGSTADFAPQGAPPNSTGKRKAAWLPNGRGILIEDEISTDGKVARQIVRKMTLSPDGKLLTVDLLIDDNRGSFELKRVYNKAD